MDNNLISIDDDDDEEFALFFHPCRNQVQVASHICDSLEMSLYRLFILVGFGITL